MPNGAWLAGGCSGRQLHDDNFIDQTSCHDDDCSYIMQSSINFHLMSKADGMEM